MATVERTNGAATHQTTTAAGGKTATDAPGELAGAPGPVVRDEPDVAYLKKQVLALITVLRQKGVFTYPEFLAEVHRLETVGHEPGARVVARAWADAAFKERLLADPRAAVAELGIEVGGYDELRV